MKRIFNVTVDNENYQVEVEEIKADNEVISSSTNNVSKPANKDRKLFLETTAESRKVNSCGVVAAPMAGKILDIKVSEGDNVTQGDLLIILEAMKMENEISSPASGQIKSIKVSKNQTVDSGEVLLEIN